MDKSVSAKNDRKVSAKKKKQVVTSSHLDSSHNNVLYVFVQLHDVFDVSCKIVMVRRSLR